ncbi:isochorismatase family cysteine hydrolase [Aquibium sp. LZ166]|uniref:Isochorismatase family cysteine hydrolase n=1 Tax=Aquibium pacificus TaxID=3153579 RepID=A0ABV3SR64_9HYPH
MHSVTIPDTFREKIARRRGRFEIFDRLDPARTALIVVDMQKAFVAEGAPVEVPLARGIIANVNRLAAACRAAGAPLVWIRTTLTDETGAHPWPVFFEHFNTPESGARLLAALSENSPWHGLADGLAVEPGDLHVSKNRFSCFIQGASTLDMVLRSRGIDHIIICGTLTNRCCESTARDAMMIGYRVVFVEDANAAVTDEEHVAALINVAATFGDVRRTDDVVGMIG